MVMAAIPLIASAIPAIASMFGGKGDAGNKAAAGSNEQMLGAHLAAKAADHPVTKGTDLPPILAATLADKLPTSGHVTTAAALTKLGHPGVLAPHLEHAISTLGARQGAADLKRHQERAARAEVRRVHAAVLPQLEQVKDQLRQRATQLQATAEHKAIVDRDGRWRAAADRMATIQRKLDTIEARMNRYNNRF